MTSPQLNWSEGLVESNILLRAFSKSFLWFGKCPFLINQQSFFSKKTHLKSRKRVFQQKGIHYFFRRKSLIRALQEQFLKAIFPFKNSPFYLFQSDPNLKQHLSMFIYCRKSMTIISRNQNGKVCGKNVETHYMLVLSSQIQGKSRKHCGYMVIQILNMDKYNTPFYSNRLGGLFPKTEWSIR